MSELKPCPFCGGEAEIDIMMYDSLRRDDYFVGCTNDDCRVSCHSQNPSKDKAIKAWNTRAQEGDHAAE